MGIMTAGMISPMPPRMMMTDRTLSTVAANVACDRARAANISPAMCIASGRLRCPSAQLKILPSPLGKIDRTPKAVASDSPDATWATSSGTRP